MIFRNTEGDRVLKIYSNDQSPLSVHNGGYLASFTNGLDPEIIIVFDQDGASRILCSRAIRESVELECEFVCKNGRSPSFVDVAFKAAWSGVPFVLASGCRTGLLIMVGILVGQFSSMVDGVEDNKRVGNLDINLTRGLNMLRDPDANLVEFDASLGMSFLPEIGLCEETAHSGERVLLELRGRE